METSRSIGRWYKITFRPQAFSVPELASELEGAKLQRAVRAGHITRRVASLSDVEDYRELPDEKRLALLQAARYASAMNAVSPLPIVVALVALWASFTPRVADAAGIPIRGQVITMWLLLMVLVVVGMQLLFDQAKSLGRARTWADVLADTEKELSATRAAALSSPLKTPRAVLRIRQRRASRVR